MATVTSERELVVLADWMDERPGEAWALVAFDSRETVLALHALVNTQETIRQAIRKSGAFRVLGAAIEVDTPNVRAWMADGPVDVSRAIGLGDGLLLRPAVAAIAGRGSELERPILEVRDDGMLLVKSGEGWATIDLTELAAVCRGI